MYSHSYNIKKLLDKLITYAKSMIAGYTLQRYAQETGGITLATSFYLRYKILNRVKKFLGTGYVEGIVECNDKFFRESFKDGHSENSTFKIPQKSYKRVVKPDHNVTLKELKKRGIS